MKSFNGNVIRTKQWWRRHIKNIVVEGGTRVLSGVEDDLSIDEKYAKYNSAVRGTGNCGINKMRYVWAVSRRQLVMESYKFSGVMVFSLKYWKSSAEIAPKFL